MVTSVKLYTSVASKVATIIWMLVAVGDLKYNNSYNSGGQT